MHEKSQEKFPAKSPGPACNPLKHLSAEEFAALGGQSIVFAHQIDAADLLQMLPETEIDPEAGALQLLMSADGTPILVTDSKDALDAWIEDKPVQEVLVH